MTPQELDTIGRALFPDAKGWQGELADLLGVSLKTINNWATGRIDIPQPWACVIRLAYHYPKVFQEIWR